MKCKTKFQFVGDDGSEVSVDLSNMKLSDDQVGILEKIASDRGPAKLNREEWEKIKDLKAGIGGIPDETALIVRFDWTWVRIDERIRDFDELTNPGLQLKDQ